MMTRPAGLTTLHNSWVEQSKKCREVIYHSFIEI
jgi:hypothetical protein